MYITPLRKDRSTIIFNAIPKVVTTFGQNLELWKKVYFGPKKIGRPLKSNFSNEKHRRYFDCLVCIMIVFPRLEPHKLEF